MTVDVVDPAGQGADGASWGTRNIMADPAAPGTIFLVCDPHYCSRGGVKGCEWRCVWNDTEVAVVEGYVAGAKLFGATAVIFAMAGIFADP